MTLNDYLNLITSEHRDKPNFVATVTIMAQAGVDLQNNEALLIPAFDIDDTLNCVGVFLDIIGQWAGISRNVVVPVTGVYFTWGGTVATGWAYGIWEDPYSPGAVSMLPDDVYRTLIKAKIAANHWDGTVEDAYLIYAKVFPGATILIQDNQDMSMDVALVGTPPDSLTLALLTGGYIALKPEGVKINEYFIPVNDGPLFAWGLSSEYVGGWGTGSWASVVKPT